MIGQYVRRKVMPRTEPHKWKRQVTYMDARGALIGACRIWRVLSSCDQHGVWGLMALVILAVLAIQMTFFCHRG